MDDARAKFLRKTSCAMLRFDYASRLFANKRWSGMGVRKMPGGVCTRTMDLRINRSKKWDPDYFIEIYQVSNSSAMHSSEFAQIKEKISTFKF